MSLCNRTVPSVHPKVSDFSFVLFPARAGNKQRIALIGLGGVWSVLAFSGQPLVLKLVRFRNLARRRPVDNRH